MRALKNTVLYLLARSLIGLLRLLPLRLSLALGRDLGRLGGRLARRERERALGNLALALPALDDRARRALVRDMFAHFGEAVAECARLPALLTRPQVVSFAPGSREVLEQAAAEGHGVIFVTGHLGNWELMAAALARLVPASVLFKPSYDPRFTRLLGAFRSANRLSSIDVTRPGHVLAATTALRHGGALGVLIDHRPPAGSPVPFFGRAALTSRLAPVLARRTGAAVVVGTSVRTGTCQHCVTIVRVRDPGGWRDPMTSLQLITTALEQAISRTPRQWAWSLDRWRGAGSG